MLGDAKRERRVVSVFGLRDELQRVSGLERRSDRLRNRCDGLKACILVGKVRVL
jgi:hypothetical protein